MASAALPVPSGGGRVLRGDNDIVMAALNGRLGAVRHLLRTVPGAVARKDGDGWTALHEAAIRGRVEICRVLLAAGAEVDARNDEGLSALKRWKLEAFSFLSHFAQTKKGSPTTVLWEISRCQTKSKSKCEM